MRVNEFFCYYPLRETCAVHVRRGDYLLYLNVYTILGVDYYTECISRARSSRFLVFSNDIEWCKSQTCFQGDRFQFAGLELSANETLYAMIQCSEFIIANSSLS